MRRYDCRSAPHAGGPPKKAGRSSARQPSHRYLLPRFGSRPKTASAHLQLELELENPWRLLRRLLVVAAGWRARSTACPSGGFAPAGGAIRAWAAVREPGNRRFVGSWKPLFFGFSQRQKAQGKQPCSIVLGAKTSRSEGPFGRPEPGFLAPVTLPWQPRGMALTPAEKQQRYRNKLKARSQASPEGGRSCVVGRGRVRQAW
jgi:hypothetical protein